MAASVERFGGRVLVLLSRNDYTAVEFLEVSSASRAWRQALRVNRTTWTPVEGSDHTFSTEAWRRGVADATAVWISTNCSKAVLRVVSPLS
jgi:hypothetical protein